MRKFPHVLAPLAGLALSACAVGPDYRPPAPPSAAAGAFVTTAPRIDAAAALPDDWWKLYEDPALDALVTQAFVANTDLRVASANLAKARAVLSEARAGRLPSTTLNGGAPYGDGIQGAGQSGFPGNLGDAQWSQFAGMSLSWEADLFGRVSRAIQAARADAGAIEAARDTVRVTVAAETTRAYLNACAAAYALDVARQSYKASGDSFRLVSEQEKAGSVGKLDVERAGAATATARAAIPALEGQQQVALFELAALLGTTPDQVPESARRCTTPPEPKASIPVGDGAALLRRRPDLRQAERQLAADTARIGVATADLYPRISLGGSGNFFRNDQVRGANSFSFSLGPLISWSFPNIAVARTRIRQAQAQGEASLAAFDGRLITALKEVEQALTVVTTEQRRLDALGEAQARAEKAYEFADLRYRAGSVAYLDVLVAQSEMLNARSSYAGSIQRLSSARVDLFKALGGGWQGIQSAQGPVQEPAGSGDASAATEQDSLPFRDATKALRH
ncbi:MULTISPECIES: efflux transporter outer membrane subunit [Sphingomonadaceae]|uniref:Efflux transporter outer membrane subunit n=1 Tax=Sphingomonas molluscorum TaxID=418184 RepID=A0ABU8Q9S0_9SPHN|nr:MULTISPECIES: efflux transporter outer membrane subunit [Sphingomonadaceae]EXS70684.1 transporter [Sphingobium sp. Ant17]MBM7407866.1 NodT family efflux transporter outer membrane factor (OMF) lipoprotein [Sphingomonas sp. JUb134]